MVSFKEITDLAVLSYGMNFINDAEFLLVYKRVSMGWWLLWLSAKLSALLQLSVNFFQLRLTKNLKINFFCFKELNINKPVSFLTLKQNKGLRISRDEISYTFEKF